MTHIKRPAARPPVASMSTTLGCVQFHQRIQEIPAIVQGLHSDALIQSVNIAEIGIDEHAADAVGRYSRLGHIYGISTRGLQHRHYFDTWIDLASDLLDRLHDLGGQRRRPYLRV